MPTTCKRGKINDNDHLLGKLKNIKTCHTGLFKKVDDDEMKI